MSELTRDDIDHILSLIDKSSFDELTLEMGDLKLALKKPGAASSVSAPMPTAPEAPAPTAAAAPVPGTALNDGQDVPAPLLGTFYHASKPGAAPFVAVGDVVTADTVIGIIEVMKLMNQVTSGIDGIVTEIVAPNGELVEHGQSLIRVKPA